MSTENVTTAVPSTTAAPVASVANAEAPQGLAAASSAAVEAVKETVNQAPASSLDFIPESYRESSWATKYKTSEELFKGIDSMAKLVGQKQIVEGLKVPGADATDEEVNAFYKQIGRPEAADKYELPEDVKAFEGMDIAAEKKAISDIAFKHGLTQKQAAGIFKDYIEKMNVEFGTAQAKVKETFDKALLTAFGQDFQKDFDLAKKGAKALGIGTTLDSEGLSSNPTVLKLCAELGKYVGEDDFVTGASAESSESLLAEAKELQASQKYKSGDKVTVARVTEIYKKVYPN